MTNKTHPNTHQQQGACAADNGRILIEEGFLEETHLAFLLSSAANPRAQNGPRKLISVPAWLSNRLLSLLPGGKDAGAAAFKAAEEEVLLPLYETVGDHPEHQDQHVSGPNQGQLAAGHVGVVYLEGDGDFILANTVTGAEHRVSIEPGKFISWPNMAFRHRVEGASLAHRSMLGPMTFDAASNGLVGLGCGPPPPPPDPVVCTGVSGYECVTPEPVMYELGTDAFLCSAGCFNQFGYVWSGFDTQSKSRVCRAGGEVCRACVDIHSRTDLMYHYHNFISITDNVCYCYSSICTAFVPGSTYITQGWELVRLVWYVGGGGGGGKRTMSRK